MRGAESMPEAKAATVSHRKGGAREGEKAVGGGSGEVAASRRARERSLVGGQPVDLVDLIISGVEALCAFQPGYTS